MLLLVVALLQQVPTVALTRPTASPKESFTEVSSVFELPDRRLLVADQMERRLVLLDPTSSAVKSLGRLGEGPREFRRPGLLLPRPNHGALLWDYSLRRFLPINPDGSLEDAIPMPSVAYLSVTGVDRQGRVYAKTLGQRMGATREDSAWVTRWTPPAQTIDTVMRVNRNGAARIIPRGGLLPTFPAWDAQALLLTGDIVTLEAATYRVTIWRDGKRIASTQVPWTPVPVTNEEKTAFLAGWEGLKTLSSTGPGRRAPVAAPKRGKLSDFNFPAFKPPFVDEAVYASSDDHIWVRRSTVHTDSVPQYDVLDATGRLVGRVALPLRTTIVGFGMGVVYLGEKNEDDEVRLRRYPLPKFGA